MPLAARAAATLAAGTAGGAVFAWFNLPLAWMLGAMVATTVASLGGARVHVPGPWRSIMLAIIGVMIGANFTPEIVEQARAWPLTIGCLVIYLAILIGILFIYFRRVVGLDAPTAYFSAAPGGLSEMVLTGGAMGGDDRTIALIHATRILLVVLLIPFWFRFMTGMTTDLSAVGPSMGATSLGDLAVLAACAVVGVVAGRLVRLPAYRMAGPMLVSAVVHAAGLSESSPPAEIVAVAQVVVGSAVGARFTGVPVRRVFGLMAASVVSTAVMLGTAVAFALVLARATGFDWQSIFLVYAPGGTAEMSLIALSLGIEVAFVATHHVIRITLIVTVVPLLFARFRSRRERA